MYVDMGNEDTSGSVGLLGFADMLTRLPKTSGGDEIQINSATLTLTTDVASGIHGTIALRRVLTDWLLTTAGSNESNVHSDASDVSGSVEWATDPDSSVGTYNSGWSWGSSDYASSGVNVASWNAGWNATNQINVTSLIEDMYNANANNGFVIRMTAAGDDVGGNGITDSIKVLTSESTKGPMLVIDYQYVAVGPTTYTLDVVNGTGDGDYTQGTLVAISADASATGQSFSVWTGDTTGIASTSSASTTINMPAADATITASYSYNNYTLTVTSGSGDGSYTYNQAINIAADAAPTGQVFSAWTGDTTGVASTTSASTTITMPASNATITATYTAITYTLSVVNGTGDGSYTDGQVVNICADSALPGQTFSAWTGDTTGVASTTTASTTITMPSAAATITATYSYNNYTLTVTSGGGDGTYTYNQLVNISADAAPTDQTFDDWIGDTTGVADINASSTTINMPASNATVTATYKAITLLTAKFGDGGDSGYESGTVDDVQIEFSQWNNNTNNGITAPIFYTTNEDTSGRLMLLGFVDLMTRLPATSGGDDITIDSATLVLTTQSSWGDNGTVKVSRMLTDWLTTTAGSNETNVHSDAADVSGSVEWGSDPDSSVGTYNSGWSWGSSDYDDANGATATWTGGWNQTTTFDITDVVQGMYDAGNNYGFVLKMTAEGDTGTTDQVVPRTSESSEGPLLTVVYSYGGGGAPASYTLTVTSGSGDGDYTENQVVNISADAAPIGQSFSAWTGDTTGITSTTSASTTISMPGSAATITATYSYDSYTLTVTSGTGDGSYTYNQVVNIASDTAQTGQSFSSWAGDTAGIANVNSSSTTITMPAAAATITATYSGTQYTLTVASGSGDGSYTYNQVVNIAADTPPTGQSFSAWTGDTTGVANVNAAGTTITMPAAAATITATYSYNNYSLTVVSGTGDGSYTYGQVVAVAADAAPTDQAFYQWSGDTSGLADASAASTNMTMPAAAAAITATYQNLYTLSVVSGTGDGDYTQGSVVAITADISPTGQQFDDWIGDTINVADITLASTTITINSSDATVTATYATISLSTAVFGEGGDSGFGPSTLDDVEIIFSEWNNNTSNAVTAAVYYNSNEDTSGRLMLLGFAEMMSRLPKTSGGDTIYIDSATLTLSTQSTYGHNGTVEVSRMLTDWLVGTAGTNETNVHSDASDVSGGVEWATDPDSSVGTYNTGWSWGSSDYDSAGGATAIWNAGWNYSTSFDMTDVIQDMYDANANYGFVIRMTAEGDTGTTDQIIPRTSEAGGLAPQLTITYSYNGGSGNYSLDVVSGTGDGIYTQGQVVAISADPPATGASFTAWTGDTTGITSTTSSSTNITIQASDATITATYSNDTYTLTVVSGTGDGSYTYTQVVNVDADTAPTGESFSAWVGDTGGLASTTSPSTTYTMDTSNAAITATYSGGATYYTLSVVNGSGDGDYTQGHSVNISADAAATGQSFSAWTGDTSGITSTTSASTTISMPAAAATITATYSYDSYTLTVTSGTGDGSYTYGQVVAIAADSNPTGQVFDDWIGDTSGVTDVSDPTTNITMPAGNATITATYVTAYTLNVVSGSGDGDYAVATIVAIAADAAPTGQQFDDWVGNTTGIANVNDPTTNITIQSADATITATYATATGYSLTVTSGSGDGSYATGAEVSVSADSAPTSQIFDAWVGDIGGILNPYMPDTIYTMPAGAATITATYASYTAVTGSTTISSSGYYRMTQDVTTSGTAFTIDADDVVLDLGGYTLTYNNTSGNSEYGVNILLGSDRITVRNGAIIQGSGGGSGCKAITMAPASWCYGPYELCYLEIYVHGDNTNGIYVRDFSNSEVHHIYLDSDANTNSLDGSGAVGIQINANNEGNLSFHDNIVSGAHRPMHLDYLGFGITSPGKSYIYNNLAQPKRRLGGQKAPYGILFAKSRNVDVYDNQIITDYGRGFMLDGYGQGVPRGTDYIYVYDNRVDVQYSIECVATENYPENNVYGIRDRYSSGNNTFENNIVMVTNDAGTGGNRKATCFAIASDAFDTLMVNLVVTDNIAIARAGTAADNPQCFGFGNCKEISITDNEYQTDGLVRTAGNNGCETLVFTGNTVFGPTRNNPPATPTGLRLVKFLNGNYLLRWDDNSEPDVLEYYVYKDGSKISGLSTRGGTFYIDRDVSGTHTYAISAVNLSGDESSTTSTVSTSNAQDGWWEN